MIPATEATAKRKRMLFLGKADIQNSYVAFDGQSILLTRSARRINTSWRSHMAHYLHCRCFSWQYKAGFGARILLTMKKPVPKSVAFDTLLGPVEDSHLHDKDAEAVIQYAEQEKQAEEEQTGRQPTILWALHCVKGLVKVLQVSWKAVKSWMRSQLLQCQVRLCKLKLAVQCLVPQMMFSWMTLDLQCQWHHLVTMMKLTAQEKQQHLVQVIIQVKRRWRNSAQRKQNGSAVTDSTVKVAYKEYFTMDDYTTDLDTEDAMDDNDDWDGEDAVILSGIPDALWSDALIDQLAPEPPEKWIDDLADRVEIPCLCSMQVLVLREGFHGEIIGSLTTKMVRVWKLKFLEKENTKESVGCVDHDWWPGNLQQQRDWIRLAQPLGHTRRTFYNSNTLEWRCISLKGIKLSLIVFTVPLLARKRKSEPHTDFFLGVNKQTVEPCSGNNLFIFDWPALESPKRNMSIFKQFTQNIFFSHRRCLA